MDFVCDKYRTGDSQLIDVCQRLAVFGYDFEDIEYVQNLVSGGCGIKGRSADLNQNNHAFLELDAHLGFFDMKKHLTSGIIKKHGNVAAGIILEKTLEFFFGTMQKDPITPVLHKIFRRI